MVDKKYQIRCVCCKIDFTTFPTSEISDDNFVYYKCIECREKQYEKMFWWLSWISKVKRTLYGRLLILVFSPILLLFFATMAIITLSYCMLKHVLWTWIAMPIIYWVKIGCIPTHYNGQVSTKPEFNLSQCINVGVENINFEDLVSNLKITNKKYTYGSLVGYVNREFKPVELKEIVKTLHELGYRLDVDSCE